MPRRESNVNKFSPPKYRFFLDANISSKTVSKLNVLTQFDFVHISSLSPTSLSDSRIIAVAKELRRITITHDLDYGEIYYLKERGRIGVIMLRLHDQTPDNVVQKLHSFLNSTQCQNTELSTALVIIEEEKTRIFSP